MLTVLLVTQVIITLAMIGIILIQRNASDGLSGIGGGGAAGGGGLMSSRATANALTRATAFLAALFMINALAMAAITARANQSTVSIADELGTIERTGESSDTLGVPIAPTDETTPADTPSVPVAE